MELKSNEYNVSVASSLALCLSVLIPMIILLKKDIDLCLLSEVSQKLVVGIDERILAVLISKALSDVFPDS